MAPEKPNRTACLAFNITDTLTEGDMADRYKDIAGKRFGRLVAVSVEEIKAGYRVYWLCRCDCGVVKSIRADGLASGVVQSCGCLGKERRAEASIKACTTHGMASAGYKRSPEYRSWSQMKVRCLVPTNHKYKDYGARGVAVCESWMSFENFYHDMGPRPQGTSLDRIDVNGNYEPGNCRWADAKTQRNNRRDSVRKAA